MAEVTENAAAECWYNFHKYPHVYKLSKLIVYNVIHCYAFDTVEHSHELALYISREADINSTLQSYSSERIFLYPF